MIKKLILALALVVLSVGGYFAWKLRPQVDEIPQELETVAEEVDHLAIKFRAQGPLPELTLRDLAGTTAYFVIQGKESMQASEGKHLSRALNRWVYPEKVQGYWIGDADGMGLFAKKIEDSFVKHMRDESQWPIYLDFDGAMIETFKLPKGHTGFLVLGPDGEILLRHSGNADEAKIEEIRQALGAEEPPPAPPAPEFAAGDFDLESCNEKGCILVFLDGKLSRSQVPGIEGGYEGEDEDRWELGRQPNIRNVGMVIGGWDLEANGVKAGIVGECEGLENEGAEILGPSPELREAFGVGADEACMVVVKGGQLSFLERGKIEFWKFGQVGDVLGIEAKDPDDEDKEDEEEKKE